MPFAVAVVEAEALGCRLPAAMADWTKAGKADSAVEEESYTQERWSKAFLDGCQGMLRL